MKRFDHLNERFQGCAQTICRLMRNDPSFAELCEDYEEAATALKFWNSPPRRSKQQVGEYRNLASELAAEIEAILRHFGRSDL